MALDMRAAIGSATRAAQNARCDEYGIKLIQVSSHLGARPLCAPYQGKIYSRDGSRGVTTDGAGGKIEYTPLSETSYGDPAGLFGVNCGHVQFPFIPGVDMQKFFPYPKDENDEYYKKLQRQRTLERQIKATKRECMMFNATNDDEELMRSSMKLRNQQEQYANYCKTAGLKQNNDRTQVYGFDKTVSSKMSWEERKSQLVLDNSAKSGIINNNNRFERADGPLSESYRETLENRYENGTATARAVYDKYIPSGGAVKNGDYNGTPYHSQNSHKIYMDFKEDFVDKKGSGTTWFHEHGHYIDQEVGFVSRSEVYRQALINDVTAFEEAYGRLYGLSTIDEIIEAVMDNEFAPNYNPTHSIQDIFGGVHGKRYNGAAYGHNADDWERTGYWGITSEAFAHMFEASFDPETQEYMKKYLPTAWAEFEKLMEGLL